MYHDACTRSLAASAKTRAFSDPQPYLPTLVIYRTSVLFGQSGFQNLKLDASATETFPDWSDTGRRVYLITVLRSRTGIAPARDQCLRAEILELPAQFG